jgi:transcriptional regulator with PAS, ATPase and Fis domain
MAVVVCEAHSSSTGFSLEQPPANGATRSGRGLFASCREIAALADIRSVLQTIPRLAMGVCPARGAQLLEIAADGSGAVLAAHGLSLRTEPDSSARPARWTLDILPSLVAGTRLLLVMEREPGATFHSQEARELELFALVSSSALARARSDAELRASHAIETAVVSAVQDAVIALDANGIVRSLSGSAARLIGCPRSAAIGKRLRDLPGVAPLALALAAGDRCPESVTLAAGEVKLHLRRCEAGLAVTLLPTSPGATRIGGAHFGIGDLLGESPLIRRARETAQRLADSRLPILITGETGTGKEILAQAIHNASAQAGQPFVGVNVSAIPRELLESELFGYEAGAFTGACAHGHRGKFELAQNGTLLLDEVGDMPLEMQSKLLRVLQERVVQRLGGSGPKAFSARVIASTNRDLERDVADGRFRLDLLHRLRAVHVELPPLRERGNDVRLLVAHQLRLVAQNTGRAPIFVAPQVMAAFEAYAWPGNVRELVNMVDCEIRMLPPDKNVIDVVPEAIERGLRHAGATVGGDMTLEAAEREACIRALKKTCGNVARAARILGVVKATLYSKMRRYGIPHTRTEPGISQATDPSISRQWRAADADR